MTKFTRLFLLSLFFISTGCFHTQSNVQTNSPEQSADQTQAPFEVPPPNINLANPLVVSQKPDDVAMCAKINAAIDQSPYQNAHWGVIAVSLKDGRVACSRDGRKLFNPASIEKTLTSIVALDKLGADYRWKTSIEAVNPIDANGVLNGDLTIYGEGAPDFDDAALENLVSQLQAKGLKRIKGSVIGDASYFRGDTVGDGWTWNELQWYYGAEAGALTFNENQAFVNVENGVGKTSTDYIHVTVGNPAPLVYGASEPKLEPSGVQRGLDDNEFYIWGTSKNFGVRVAVHDPAKWAAKSLKESLEKKGIAVEGEVLSKDWKSEDRLDPSKAQKFAEVESQTLGEIVRKMNKRSVNLYAELILRTIGKKFASEITGDVQIPQSVRGDSTNGAAIVKSWLMNHRVAADEMQISDGSGLSRTNFVTPESFARALIAAAQSKFAQTFTDSLPIAATDGTLGGRLAKAKGKILAKTGTESFINSLAGYAQNKNGEIFTFAIIVNNETHKNAAVSVIDQIALILAGAADEKEGNSKAAKTNQNANANDDANKSNFVTNAVR